MIDFNSARLQRPDQIAPQNDTDFSFAERMAEFGLRPPELIFDGKLHRFDIAKGDKAGWYVFYPGNDFAAGAFGNWKEDLTEKWCNRNESTLSWEERKAYQEWQQQIRKAREEEEARNHQQARLVARRIWEAAIPAIEHPYLRKKGIQPHYTRIGNDGRLIVPELDEHGDIWGLQYIDDDGNKKFQYMARRDGLFFEMPGGEPVYLCEGFSTGATINEATGATVICAFNAGSLPKVARVIKERWPRRQIVVAADNDQYSAKNAGILKANEAAKILSAPVVFPTFVNVASKPTDFNDLAALEGVAAVTLQLAQHDKKAAFPPLSPDATKLAGRLKKRPDPREFVWNCYGHGFLPKGVVGVLAATGGVGKTFFLSSLAVMTASGKAFGPIEATRAMKTLMIYGEDDQDEVERRLWDITNGDFPENLHAASVFGSVGPLMELEGNRPKRANGFYWLEETVRSHDGLELLIIDPKSRFYGLDENNNDHATQWIQSLEYLVKEYGLTILFAAHTSDANSKTISQVMNRGASALVDGCRWQAGLIRLDKKTAEYYGIQEERKYLVFDAPKNNYSASINRPIYFKRGEHGELISCNLKEDAEKAKADFVFELLKRDPELRTRRELSRDKDFTAEVREVFKRFSEKDVYPILDKLINEKRIIEAPVEGHDSRRLILQVSLD